MGKYDRHANLPLCFFALPCSALPAAPPSPSSSGFRRPAARPLRSFVSAVVGWVDPQFLRKFVHGATPRGWVAGTSQNETRGHPQPRGTEDRQKKDKRKRGTADNTYVAAMSAPGERERARAPHDAHKTQKDITHTQRTYSSTIQNPCKARQGTKQGRAVQQRVA